MSTTPELTPCDHKWVTYQFVESVTKERVCNVCGVNERDLPAPAPVYVVPGEIDPHLWSGYGI